jgi:hypothetical protein
MSQDTTRRDVVKKITIFVGGVATLIELPARWTKPVVESIIAPAHAALSAATTTAAPKATTTTAAPATTTTTAPPTTTGGPTTTPGPTTTRGIT